MYKDVLRSISDIGIFPVISFVIFFSFFVLLLWWVAKMKRTQLDVMQNLPFDDVSTSNFSNTDPNYPKQTQL